MDRGTARDRGGGGGVPNRVDTIDVDMVPMHASGGTI